MKIQDNGILIHKKNFGEGKLLACFFTQSHGKIVGILRRSSKTTLDLGTHAEITWSARLEDQLGTLSVEPLSTPSAFCIGNYQALLSLQSATSLLYDMLAEKHPYETLYGVVHEFLKSLRGDCKSAYAQFELTLLREMGFGLDLSKCAVSGSIKNLAYVSPKTGRSVSATEGFLYKEKLLPFPVLLQNDNGDLSEALFTFGYFLQKHFYAPQNKKLPQARLQLMHISTQPMQKIAS